jgi:catechol 2,3-dioxygenase-like lactoylglutathione lyase family enzyme
MQIDAIVFDCGDATPLARFWAAALGWSLAPYDDAEIARLAAVGVHDIRDDPSVVVEPPEDQPGCPRLFFTEVPEPKQVKNRLHLDVIADDDLETEVARLEALGATVRNWAEEAGGFWCVMTDPEGNEFCVMPPDDAA